MYYARQCVGRVKNHERVVMKRSKIRLGLFLAVVLVGVVGSLLTESVWSPHVRRFFYTVDADLEIAKLSSLYKEHCARPGYGEHPQDVKAQCAQIDQRLYTLREQKRAVAVEDWKKEVGSFFTTDVK